MLDTLTCILCFCLNIHLSVPWVLDSKNHTNAAHRMSVQLWSLHVSHS